MPSLNTVHECFKFNGEHYGFRDLKTLALHLIKTEEYYKKDIGEFLYQWQDTSNTIALKTSGSTGTPKTIVIKKQAMVNSAIATGIHFNLQPGSTALLCLPAHYIAGKMMLVRALVLGLEMDSIEPKSNLQIDLEKQYHFTAMVPLQLEKNEDKLKAIKTVIVGGAKVSSALNSKLKELKTTIFETYGMTETVSHIAVKQLNNTTKNNSFKTLPNIKITQDDRGCLIVDAPRVSTAVIITNDVVKLLSENEFEWIGRADTIINSGGIKIFPEQVENLLSGKISNRFFIASEEDETLGERVILIIEGEENDLDISLFNTLDSYSKPKKTYYLSNFVETTSGKIQRKKTLQLLKK
ncbi:AMP-binding protein [Lacinutrix sp. Bg11-31]|uniref:AMP-binding protein n=1 Tax=Lacinutrix sp. Bg11-31 TaxID=2057808 RepID=UPI000C307D90|nr:AMP-binding protein [Lacinutrix sp. Bg11-31]AUC81267.1 O-succinylbenzoic acid--CoA ligase [Lacinutrix sp. Bg11-31]